MRRFRKFFFADGIAQIPRGVKLITLSRTIRWFGWGLGESLIPIFLLHFSNSYTETGLFRSIYDIVFILALPFAGILADYVSARTLIVAALLIYPFVGIGYYLAGVTGLGIFVIIARATNGLTYCLETVGIDTYVRRTAGRALASRAFGFLSSLANFGWLAAALCGFFLVRFVPVHELLFIIAPTSLIALIPILWLDHARPNISRVGANLWHPYRAFLVELRSWNANLRRIAFLSFSLTVLSVMTTFFLPIAAYAEGADLSQVIAMTMLFTVPSLAAWQIANLIEGLPRRRLLLASLPLTGGLLAAVALFPTIAVEIVAAYFIELLIVAAGLILQTYTAAACTGDHCGRISSALEGVDTFGELTAPIAAGMLADLMGLSGMFAIAALFALLVSWYAYRYRVG